MITEIKNKFRRFQKTRLWATTLNLFGILVVVNLFANLLPWRLDLTATRLHSLTPATKEVVQKLNDLVIIKAFVSSNLPPQFTPLGETLRSLLAEYQRISKGQIRTYWLDPQKDQKAKKEAVNLGITPLQFSTLQKDKFQLVQGYFGLAIFYQGKKEIIPAISDFANLEYTLTATIKKLASSKLPTVGFTSGHGEIPFTQRETLQRVLRLNQQITTITFNEESKDLAQKTDVLVILGPKEKFTTKEQAILDAYLAAGKGLALFLDKIKVEQGLLPSQIETGLEEWLKKQGVALENQLVLDASSTMASFRTNWGTVLVAYPFWIQIRPEGLNKKNPVTAPLSTILFTWAAPLKVLNNSNIQILVNSSPRSWTTDQLLNISPTLQLQPPTETQSYPLVVLKEKLAVVGDADFLTDQVTARHPENLEFFANLIDYLAQDKQLLTIRGKTVLSRPLRPLSESEKQTIKAVNLAFGPIVLLGLAGFTRWQRKRQQWEK